MKSWHDNEVYETVDVRTFTPKNYVTGRWVLTVKRDGNGNFDKCKARWVLRGFQDKQKLGTTNRESDFDKSGLSPCMSALC